MMIDGKIADLSAYDNIPLKVGVLQKLSAIHRTAAGLLLPDL